MHDTFSGNKQVKVVSTFEALINTKFEGDVNAICWHRNLIGDFEEVLSKLQLKENVTDISIDELLSLQLSAAGNLARDIIMNDLKSLTDLGALPSLNLLKNYERDEEFDFISTDVYSYHVDRSSIGTDTFLCTYRGASSDILPNNQVEQKILIPEIRQKLKDLHDGPEAEFEAFLEEYFFDLHYQAKPEAKHTNLGVGHLWKLAVDHPDQEVMPCVHRAPKENKDECRLLLIC
ncbi:DUF1826 domain-containing protein [Pedobacter aquatilis]|uniref:DUF1826 domain-containing protein n=1 Tax=Pedobacter aquatilis TaxID=351343 RepID=UPI002930591F|nr:DUF1826 domain-containing protein [Pedobacter aquatilis]